MRILSVDDEKDAEMLFRQKSRKEMKKWEVYLECAFSRQNDLVFLGKEKPPKVRDVFSDISMSGMAGLDLLRLVKAKQTATNESMISAYGDEANHHKGGSSGSKEFIAKSILFDSLKVKIAKPINK